jgi:hypothetical protein
LLNGFVEQEGHLNKNSTTGFIAESLQFVTINPHLNKDVGLICLNLLKPSEPNEALPNVPEPFGNDPHKVVSASNDDTPVSHGQVALPCLAQ